MTDQSKWSISRTSKKKDSPSKIRIAPRVKKDLLAQETCERCHRAWKDLLAAGFECGVFEEEGTEYTFHAVGGRGVTKQRCIGLKNSKDITFTHIGFEATKYHCYGLKNEASIMNRGRHSRTSDMPVISDFRSYLAAEEFKAKKILQDSGHQIEPGEISPPLSKQEILRRILNSLERDSLCEHISKEWYAAKILTVIFKLMDTIDYSSNLGKMLILAAELGGFIRESEIRFGPVASQTRKAGKQPKNISEVDAFVRSRIKSNKSLTPAALWREIDDCGDDGLKIGTAELFIENERLNVVHRSRKGKVETRSISFRTFAKYITAARKALIR
jgi:hypothetical protein